MGKTLSFAESDTNNANGTIQRHSVKYERTWIIKFIILHLKNISYYLIVLRLPQKMGNM